MNKPELIAALNEVSGKLGRELRTEGSNTELQARLDEALAELRLLEDDGEEGGVVNTFGADGDNTGDTSGGAELTETDLRNDICRIRLLTTMDILYYKTEKSVSARRVRGVVSTDSVILVTVEEAESQISRGRAEQA